MEWSFDIKRSHSFLLLYVRMRETTKQPSLYANCRPSHIAQMIFVPRLPSALWVTICSLLVIPLVGLRATGEPAYPLKLAPGQHYVVDQQSNPFFIQGDSPWFLIESLNASEVDYYLSNRWVQDYNSIILDLAATKNETGNDYEGNLYGQLPFTNTIAGPSPTSCRGISVTLRMSITSSSARVTTASTFSRIPCTTASAVLTGILGGFIG